MISVDPTINLAIIGTIGTGLVGLGVWVGALGQRLLTVEKRQVAQDEMLEVSGSRLRF